MAALRQWLRRLFGSEEHPVLGSLTYERTYHTGPASFREESNDFALAIYGQLRQQSSGNLFFSPFSIRTALAMAQAGARGETAAQMRQALCISSSSETIHAGFTEGIQRLNTGGDGKYEMVVANSLWGQDGAPIRSEYLDLTARYYGGGTNLVDFRCAAEGAREMINQWVEETTRQEIRELIPSGGVNADTRLVLVNAVYFKGNWVLKFHKAGTHEEPFHLEGGRTDQVPLMHQQEEIRYMQGNGYQAVELVYRGDDLSMLVLLPDRIDGLRDLEKKLSPQLLHDCVAQMVVREVKCFFPRFKLTWGVRDLCEQLAALGMPIAFARYKADFSGINGHEPPSEDSLFLSAVLHKAFVEVTEEGTEAAAATAVTMIAMCAPPSEKPQIPVFRADHPFLFAIRDRKSGVLLFLGRVANASPES